MLEQLYSDMMACELLCSHQNGELQCISVDMLCVCGARPVLGGFFIYRFSDSGQNEND